ncbi:hypothetical protein EZV62_007770 [Acer yangbiense]|uniref:DUF4283 domain-containing protein n=1 Tax=Acer yangbiense TaxID=1000413 RepID=A0A5C7IB82_9ROSI|nr:hypothetical protein EZV62_007770 [Acer yangbiense]
MSSNLVGKILAKKQVTGEAFKAVISKIWQIRKELEVEWISRNTFAFHFSCRDDKDRVLKRGPWSFDDGFLVLEEPEGKGDISKMKFNRADFWVQIQNVPLMCMTVEIGRFLGDIIGKVKDVDGGGSGVCMGKFLWVRVELDIDKPLRRCLCIDNLGDEEETVTPLQYERLPDFCFQCGLLARKAAQWGRIGDQRYDHGNWRRQPFSKIGQDDELWQSVVIGGDGRAGAGKASFGSQPYKWGIDSNGNGEELPIDKVGFVFKCRRESKEIRGENRASLAKFNVDPGLRDGSLDGLGLGGNKVDQGSMNLEDACVKLSPKSNEKCLARSESPTQATVNKDQVLSPAAGNWKRRVRNSKHDE